MNKRRFRILAVDDDNDVLDVLQRALEDDYEVLVASSGEKALELLRQGPVDLLITDQRMPEMSGVHLLEQAKRINPDMVRIILTGYTDPADLIDAINRGEVYRYITKPWELNDLLLTIRQGLESYQLQRDNARLVAELELRLRATASFLSISKIASRARSYEEIIEAVVAGLPELVEFDACAALVEDEGGGALLSLYCQRPLDEKLLLQLRQEVIQAHQEFCGRRLADKQVRVHLGGEQLPAPGHEEEILSRVRQPLYLDGEPAGMLMLIATRPQSFREDTGQLLDMLANQTAELIKSLREQMSVERQRLELMVRSLPDGIIMVDERDQVFVINPAARRLLHLPPDSPVSTRYLKDTLGFYPFDLVRGWQAREGAIVREEIQLGERILHSMVSPVVQESRLVGVAVVLRDITEEKRLVERKEEFVSIVSHELRTPLTSIGGALDLLLNRFAGDLNAKQERYIGLAKSGCEKLNLIIDELLDLRRLEQGRMRMDLRRMNLSALIAEAVDNYQAVALERGVHLEVDGGDNSFVYADRNRLHQVLNNLLSNALKFTTQGGHIRVEVFRSQALPGLLGVSVFNDGDEIPEEDHDRIFDKFEQARRARSGAVSGSGLGLSISRNIIETLGGSIWVESGRGEGTRFLFTLPEASEEAQPVTSDFEVGRRRATEGPRFRQPPRLLVVDDDEAISFVIKGFFRSLGYHVWLVHDARSALQLARERKPDLIVMDIRMPELDGLSATDVLRHDPDTRDIPVLALSALESEKEARQAGASAYLPKPLVFQQLQQTVERLLQEKAEAVRRFVILIVDDDHAIRNVCREVLQAQGFSTIEAENGRQALQIVERQPVDAMLLDLMLPDLDGFQVTERVRSLRQSADIPIIFISARGQTSDKVRALKLGADDYMVKPFDAMELGARVESVIHRKERELDSSPTTKLPGSVALDKELNRRISQGGRFQLCYLDLDNLKAYNDYYGYARADAVIRQTASLIEKALERCGNKDDFLAHVAGDDFVLITSPEKLDAVANEIIHNFDRLIPLFYEAEDQQRGFIEARDRFGKQRRFGIMTISLAAVLVEPGRFRSHAEISEVAAAVKMRAKQIDHSVLVKDEVPEGKEEQQ